MSSANVIDVRDLSLTFQTADGPVEALSDIDLDVERGEFVSLIGPSGCGKTTLLRVIADLEQPTGGLILVNGLTPDEARAHALLRLCLSGAGALSVAHDRQERGAAARSDGHAGGGARRAGRARTWRSST